MSERGVVSGCEYKVGNWGQLRRDVIGESDSWGERGENGSGAGVGFGGVSVTGRRFGGLFDTEAAV